MEAEKTIYAFLASIIFLFFIMFIKCLKNKLAVNIKNCYYLSDNKIEMEDKDGQKKYKKQ